MRKLSLLEKFCFLIPWVLMLMYCRAEQKYYFLDKNFTWEMARNHCKVCFKDLVILTPGNTGSIARNCKSTYYWIGLRKNLYPNISFSGYSTTNSNMSWTYWANGDPLAFQNWYPGWPVLKSSFPKRYSCSCSCNRQALKTPATTTQEVTTLAGKTSATATQEVTTLAGKTSATATQEVTTLRGKTPSTTSPEVTTPAMTTPVATNSTNQTKFIIPYSGLGEDSTENMLNIGTTECVQTSPLLYNVPETDDNYIEDSCVAMLHFGPWVERNCSESLPFICYEDEFFGQAKATNVTTNSASLTWLPNPDGVSYYDLQVTVDQNLTEIHNLNGLTYDLANLMAGTRHSVRVFPVKCERRLIPQEVTFYTKPNKVKNLTVINVTETSISLSWKKPDGNVGFYLTKVKGQEYETETVSAEVHSLTTGTLYTFYVLAGVEDRSVLSEESNISVYTKPGKVSNLSVSDNTMTSLLLSWRPPEGHYDYFLVKAMFDSNNASHKTLTFNQTKLSVNVTELPPGTRITLSVKAVIGCTKEGDTMTVFNYTVPGLNSDLQLSATATSLKATWTPSPGRNLTFTVKLNLYGRNVNTTEGQKNAVILFNQLRTAANYTVVVYSVSGAFLGPGLESSNFTLPLPPTDVRVIFSNKTQITIQWTPPDNTDRAFYVVKLNSSFWGQTQSHKLDSKTSFTFDNLKPGTKYDFEVQTWTPDISSLPDNVSHSTEADKLEVTLSMICSSPKPLYCDKTAVKEKVFNELRKNFNNFLRDHIYWTLEMLESEKIKT